MRKDKAIIYLESMMEDFYIKSTSDGRATYKGYYISRGDKFTTPENTKESCDSLATELRQHGYQCKVGCNQESGIWSVAVL